MKQRQNPCSGPPPVYLDLSTRHGWPVKNAIVDLPIILKGNSKRTSGNWLSPLDAQNKDIGSASTLPTKEITHATQATNTPLRTVTVKFNFLKASVMEAKAVCMRVCKHSCDVKVFCFLHANHANTNLKRVLS